MRNKNICHKIRRKLPFLCKYIRTTPIHRKSPPFLKALVFPREDASFRVYPPVIPCSSPSFTRPSPLRRGSARRGPAPISSKTGRTRAKCFHNFFGTRDARLCDSLRRDRQLGRVSFSGEKNTGVSCLVCVCFTSRVGGFGGCGMFLYAESPKVTSAPRAFSLDVPFGHSFWTFSFGRSV